MLAPFLKRFSTRAPAPPLAAPAPAAMSAARTPVYFVSHGGPNVMFETAHPAYAQLQKIGREITSQVRPAAVVVFSAHWQAGRRRVEVNTAASSALIYECAPPPRPPPPPR